LSAEKTPMRKIREVLRLKWTSQLSNRTIATSCSVARSTVAECLERASKAGLSWPLPDSMDDAELERLLYPTNPPLILCPLRSTSIPSGSMFGSASIIMLRSRITSTAPPIN